MVYGAEFEAEPHEREAEVLALYRDVHSDGKQYSWQNTSYEQKLRAS